MACTTSQSLISSKLSKLFLKAKILEYGAQYPRTHSVRYLLRFLRDIVPNDKRQVVSELLDRYLFELGVLEDAYIGARYVPREYTKEEAERLINVVNEIMNSGL